MNTKDGAWRILLGASVPLWKRLDSAVVWLFGGTDWNDDEDKFRATRIM